MVAYSEDKRSVLIVQMNKFENQYPLVAGYLAAFASTDPELDTNFRFSSVDFGCSAPLQSALDALQGERHDIFGLSCYVWNIRAMREAIKVIRHNNPTALIILGGPEVMNQAADLLVQTDERMIVCNGEGERAFSNILRAELHAAAFDTVAGISCYRNGQLITNEGEPRIRDLDSVPSPYLLGLFPKKYNIAILETNRGCPFRCSFCFWGAANNDKVLKFQENRIEEEITHMARNGTGTIFVADANWGMLKRDVELTRHIVACKETYGAPLALQFSASKNSPGRVREITEIMDEAGLINTQTVSMQSMSETTLDTVDRDNIKLDAYLDLQADLNERKIGSFIELIWPLPGETLKSFLSGIAQLIRHDARMLVMYPNTLLKNTPMYRDRDALGIVTRAADDLFSEEHFVVETKDASCQDVQDGNRAILAVQALFNIRTAQSLMAYLDRTGQMRYEDFIRDFGAFVCRHDTGEIGDFFRATLADQALSEFGKTTELSCLILHKRRFEFTTLLKNFCAQYDWWADAEARLCFELDILLKPYFFDNSIAEYFAHRFEFLKIEAPDAMMRNFSVRLDQAAPEMVARNLPEIGPRNYPVDQLSIAHPRRHATLSDAWAGQELYSYGNGLLTNNVKIMPTVTASELPAEV